MPTNGDMQPQGGDGAWAEAGNGDKHAAGHLGKLGTGDLTEEDLLTRLRQRKQEEEGPADQ